MGCSWCGKYSRQWKMMPAGPPEFIPMFMAKFPARLARSREPSQPALSYEHIENFTKDLEVSWGKISETWPARSTGLRTISYPGRIKVGAVKRALRSSFLNEERSTLKCVMHHTSHIKMCDAFNVGLARALFPRFWCASRPAKFSFLQTGNPIFFL